MSAQTAPLTLEEFHRLYDGTKPPYEYWYGQAIQKSMPTLLHSIVQYLIQALLRNAGWTTGSEARLKIVPNAEPVPDVIAIRGKFKGRYPTSAPELCIEILSPSDRLAQAFEKAKTYISWGSQCVWIIDPEKRTAWTLSSESGTDPIWIPPSGTLIAADTTIGLETLFQQVDNDLDQTELD